MKWAYLESVALDDVNEPHFSPCVTFSKRFHSGDSHLFPVKSETRSISKGRLQPVYVPRYLFSWRKKVSRWLHRASQKPISFIDPLARQMTEWCVFTKRNALLKSTGSRQWRDNKKPRTSLYALRVVVVWCLLHWVGAIDSRDAARQWDSAAKWVERVVCQTQSLLSWHQFHSVSSLRLKRSLDSEGYERHNSELFRVFYRWNGTSRGLRMAWKECVRV